MSKPNKARRRWDTYVQEAAKPPFELEVDDDTVITIEAPTGGQLIEAQRLQASGDVEAQLRVICGDKAFPEVFPLIQAAPGGAMTALISDIMKHFGYDVGEASASQT